MTTVARNNDQFISHSGDAWDGVGLVSTTTVYGTGTLLAGGRAVLTAAHVVDDSIGPVRVAFDTPSGRSWLSVESIQLHADYNASRLANDLALLWLEDTAPLSIPRYALYRDSDELGQVATLVGYGATGTGDSGYMPGSGGVRTAVQNRMEITRDALDQVLVDSWGQAPAGSQLLSDFDNGGSRYNSFDRLLGLGDTGLGDAEGSIAPGDSGGPAFIDGRLAGVASYTSHFTLQRGERLDNNSELDGSFGEVAAWQRVSHYQTWIDDTLAQLGGYLPAHQQDTNASDVGTFADTVEVPANDAENVTLLYASALDRRPEEQGLNYWVDRVKDGLSLPAMAGAFAESQEFITRFGAEDNADYIERLYVNSLDRRPDQTGFDYWLDAMADGLSRAETLLGFALSEENRTNTTWLEDLQYDAGTSKWKFLEMQPAAFTSAHDALPAGTLGHILEHSSIDIA